MTNRRSLLQAGAAAVGAPALTACSVLAAPMTGALRTTPPAGLPRRVNLPVPFVAQDDTLCGPATLAMLLRAAGLAAELGTLTGQVYLPGRGGSLQIEMLAATRRNGALAFTLAPQLMAVCTQLAAGTPVALLLNLALPWWPRWHYAVLTGYDLDTGQVWLHSGQTAHAEWTLTTLEHTWVRAGAWSMVALPPGQWPQAADDVAAAAAVAAFERGQGVNSPAVLEAWRSAHDRWPEGLAPTLGLGNLWLARGDAGIAASLFEAAARTHDSAAAWNNLAIARSRLSDIEAARLALTRAERRAREREPRWLPEVLATRRELGL
ncbi:MAG TPA: PA2778 family cysteine peptidase [Ideonella sp.]|uniref:PA2778 family cysteine peptidase n=1 Tax=Ideonella sp. TaxID=1929293 RepID=UPI002E2F2A16|nr:PA2778 family cysteine peptidase [Ideonella sp.]HEX5684624.1 PA2778 family cysteine peptidase [Ideonella sp.]